MKTALHYLLGTLALALLGTITYAVWMVRATLPIFGSVFLYSAIVLVAGGTLFSLAWGILHLREKHIRGKAIIMSEHGSYVMHQGQFVPLMPASVHAALYLAAPRARTKVTQVEEPVTQALRTLPAPPREIPSLTEQLECRETLPDEEQSILGYGVDGVRRGPWNKLHSFFVVGGSGSGKSSTVSYFAALAVLHGARLLIIDPDAEEDESISQRLAPLAPFFLAPVGDTPKTAARIIELANQELETPQAYPVLLIVDEFSTIMRHVKNGGMWQEVGASIASTLEDYAQRGRKRRRTAIAIGQIAKASRTGGTELRASMTATFVHRIKPQQARMILDGDEAESCEYLEPGESLVLLNNAASTYRMNIPYADETAMVMVAEIMLSRSVRSVKSGSDVGSESGSLRETPPELHVVKVARTEAEPSLELALQAKIGRVRELRESGTNMQKIIWQVWGVTKGGSQEYANARREYLQIIDTLNAEQSERVEVMEVQQ